MDDDAFWERDAAAIAAEFTERPQLFFRPFDLWLAEHERYIKSWSEIIETQDRIVAENGSETIVWDNSSYLVLERFKESLCCRMHTIRTALWLAGEECPLGCELDALLDELDTSLSKIAIKVELRTHYEKPLSCEELNRVMTLLKQRAKFESLVSSEPPAGGASTGQDDREQLMKVIIDENPKLTMKGKGDSILKRFRDAREKQGLSGIKESIGLDMIRRLKGVEKKQ